MNVCPDYIKRIGISDMIKYAEDHKRPLYSEKKNYLAFANVKIYKYWIL
jgi:hypothetical protein